MLSPSSRNLLLSLSILGAFASLTGCSASDKAQVPSSNKASDELSLWKNPDGTQATTPPVQAGSEVGVGLPGLVCSSFSDLAVSAEQLCRRQGLALVALKPDGFCGSVVYGDAVPPTDANAGSADGKVDPAPLPPTPVPGPGPVPGPIPYNWGFDHAVGVCGYGGPPPPPPCNEKDCPPDCNEKTCPQPPPPQPCTEKDCPPVTPPACPPGAACVDPQPYPCNEPTCSVPNTK